MYTKKQTTGISKNQTVRAGSKIDIADYYVLIGKTEFFLSVNEAPTWENRKTIIQKKVTPVKCIACGFPVSPYSKPITSKTGLKLTSRCLNCGYKN